MNAKKFTFVMITFNQKQYVIEQLESIKYQILHYGKNYLSYFLLCDDASSDGTVDMIKAWLDEENIFEEVKLMVSSVNQGIVKNYVKALKNVKTELFKILGGDDLYYKNNIFKAAEKWDFVITVPLKLNGDQIINGFNWSLKRYIFLKKRLKKIVLNDYKYLFVFETPGVFWNHTYADQNLYQELAPYKWCEDLICWNYLLNLKSLKIGILEKPYVIYRINCGISTNTAHIYNQDLEEEAREIHRKVFIKRFQYPACINPYRYLFKMRYLIYEHIISKISRNVKSFEDGLKHETRSAKSYYCEIREKSERWVNAHGFNHL